MFLPPGAWLNYYSFNFLLIKCFQLFLSYPEKSWVYVIWVILKSLFCFVIFVLKVHFSFLYCFALFFRMLPWKRFLYCISANPKHLDDLRALYDLPLPSQGSFLTLLPHNHHHLTNCSNSFSNNLGLVCHHLRKQVLSKLRNDQFWLQGLFSPISHSHANC